MAEFITKSGQKAHAVQVSNGNGDVITKFFEEHGVTEFGFIQGTVSPFTPKEAMFSINMKEGYEVWFIKDHMTYNVPYMYWIVFDEGETGYSSDESFKKEYTLNENSTTGI